MTSYRISLVRYTVVAACLGLAGASFATFRDWARQRDELVELLGRAGFAGGDGGVIDAVRHERSAHHAQVLAARALVYDVLDARDRTPEPIAVGSSAETGAAAALEIGSPAWDAAVDRLPAAAGLARQALAAQPGSWQAAMLLGAATYLERSIRRDRRLYTEYRDWEAPLTQALREAPGQAEPRRFLAAAYLEVWTALSPAKRARTRKLLSEAFARDVRAFSTLLPVWLEVADDFDDALAVIPDSSAAWRELERALARAHDWEAFCRVHVRGLEALYRENEERLAEAEARLRLGEYFHSRSLLLQVVATSPLDVRFAPLVARAFERYPPGLHGLSSTEPLRDWLRWALELHTYGKNPLPAQVVSRLASAAGGLQPPVQALAALVGGEIHYAESLEQLADSLASEPWAPYLLAKARWQLSRDRPGEATATLARLGRSSRRTLLYALARLRVARARGDLVETAEAERDLAAFRKREWSAAEWHWRGHRALLPMLAASRGDGLVLAVNRVPDDGAVVELRWDGRTVALHPVAGDGELELALPIDEELHLLELRMVAGEQLFPGRVRLRPAP